MSKYGQSSRTPLVGLELEKASYLQIDEKVESFMKNLKDSKQLDRLKSTQLRKVHEQVTKVRRLYIEAIAQNQSEKLEQCKKELVKFRYLLAYQEARLSRGEKEVFGVLSEWFRRAIETIMKNMQNIRLANELIEKMYITSEAIIAYHKYYGGE